MNILYILPEVKGGGIATYYKNLIGKLNRSGFDIKVIHSTNILSDEEFSDVKIECISFDLLNKYKNKFKHFQIYPNLFNDLARSWAIFEQTNGGEDFDIIELTDYPMLFLPWLLQPKKSPVVIRLAGSLGQIEFFEKRNGQHTQTAIALLIERICFGNADGLISLSSLNKKYWTSQLGNREVRFLPPPYYPEEKDLRNNNENSSHNAIVLGRVQIWKGSEELCQAAELLGDHCPCIEWVGGINYYRDYSVSMSGYLKSKYPVWGSKIIHTGKIPYAEAQQKLASAKFLIVPSLWDTFNFTVIEGMAQGKVVVCSDGAGASEHIIDGVNGFVYPAKDVKALAEKIRQADQLFNEERARIGANARETVERIFASEEPVKQRIQLYEELIRKGPSRKEDTELEWLREWLSPDGKGNQHFPEVLLDQISLQWLGKYMVNRIKKKFF